MNKVLIITYYWPPSGGAGVQRWLKFAKYLPEFGWEPVILTVDPEFAAYPVIDDSLADDLPLNIKVHRTRSIDYFSIYKKDKSKIPTAGFANKNNNSLKDKVVLFIRGNFFIPDPRRGWNKYAFKKACELIETEGIKHVITTSPPHSTQLIGLRIKRKYPEINWIADFRDPWTNIYYYKMFYQTPLAKFIDSHYEKKVLKTAEIITTIGESLGRMFGTKLTGIENKIHILPNGYDDDDFAGKTSTAPPRFTISFVGTISEYYPVDGIVKALSRIQSDRIDFVFRITGMVDQNQKNLITTTLDKDKFELITYVPHNVAIQTMLDSSLLLLIIAVHKDNRTFLSGKIFEYLASGRPVLCLGPEDGEAASLISRFKQGITFNYHDSINIENYIRSVIELPFGQKTSPYEFARRNLTKKLASILKY